jgi:hypothetical protein
MTTKLHLKDALTVLGMSALLTIFITHPGHAQDTTKTKGDKKVRIVAKVITDNNGKKQEFDTTINLDRRLKPGEEEEMMKQFEMKFRDLGDQMKELEVEMNDMKLPDSAQLDSSLQLAGRMFRHRGMPDLHFNRNFHPRAFNYDFNFELPEMPDIPQPLIEEFNDEDFPGQGEEQHEMLNGRGQSLNDLLGDIPMDRVKSYSIKDTKNGKKIVIELNKEPFIQNHRNVIIMRSPRPEGRYNQDRGQGRPHIRKRIIIHQGDQEKTPSQKNEQNEEQKVDKL